MCIPERLNSNDCCTAYGVHSKDRTACTMSKRHYIAVIKPDIKIKKLICSRIHLAVCKPIEIWKHKFLFLRGRVHSYSYIPTFIFCAQQHLLFSKLSSQSANRTYSLPNCHTSRFTNASSIKASQYRY